MPRDEIEVPKELREFMLEGTVETSLGQKNGANKQYRYGNLHIREYDEKFLVHVDKVDPRKNPLGHLVHDAPEVLIGLACAVMGGGKIATHTYNNQKDSKFSKQTSIITGLFAAVIFGYLGYFLVKRVKQR